MKRLFAFFILMSFSQGIHALQITPETISLRGVPGTKIKKEIVVHNDSKKQVNLRIETAPNIYPQNHKVKKWLKVSAKKIKLNAGEKRTVELSVKVPDQKGELTGSLIVRNMGSGKKNEWVERRSSHRVYLQIAGTEIAQAELTRIHPEKSDKEIAVRVFVKNTGNMHLQPKVVIDLNGADGEKIVQSGDVPMETILPGEEMTVSVRVPVPKGSKTIYEGKGSVFFHNAEGGLERISRKFTVD